MILQCHLPLVFNMLNDWFYSWISPAKEVSVHFVSLMQMNCPILLMCQHRHLHTEAMKEVISGVLQEDKCR